MTVPLISVIIPTYNRSEYICDAVDSVLAQTYGNIEIIIIDDGSTDNTEELLRRYGSKVKYIRQDNAGPSAARNNGIRNARGDLLAFLDSDDIWLSEKLERQIQLMEQSGGIGLVGCGSITIDSSGRAIARPVIRRNYTSKRRFVNELMVHNIVCGGVSGSLIRRECFDKLGLFCEDLWIGEDRDMWIRIANHYHMRFVEQPLIKLRSHGANLNKNIARMKMDGKKVVVRNIKRRNLILRRKAHSYRHLDIAWEYLDAGNRKLALMYMLKSIAIYPLKAYDGDGKYKLLGRCLFPSWLFNLLRKFSRVLARIVPGFKRRPVQ